MTLKYCKLRSTKVELSSHFAGVSRLIGHIFTDCVSVSSLMNNWIYKWWCKISAIHKLLRQFTAHFVPNTCTRFSISKQTYQSSKLRNDFQESKYPGYVNISNGIWRQTCRKVNQLYWRVSFVSVPCGISHATLACWKAQSVYVAGNYNLTIFSASDQTWK